MFDSFICPAQPCIMHVAFGKDILWQRKYDCVVVSHNTQRCECPALYLAFYSLPIALTVCSYGFLSGLWSFYIHNSFFYPWKCQFCLHLNFKNLLGCNNGAGHVWLWWCLFLSCAQLQKWTDVLDIFTSVLDILFANLLFDSIVNE